MKVPEYDSLQVAPNGLPQTYAQAPQMPDVAGTQAQAIGESAMKAGAAMADIARAMALDESKQQAKDADVQFIPQLNDLLHNPDSGYLSTQGKKAVDGYKPTVDAMNKLRDQTLNTLPTQLARDMADQVLTDRINSAMNTVQSHASAQQNKWRVDTSEARASLSIQDSASNYHDPVAFEKSLGTAHTEAEEQGAVLGWSPEQVAVQRNKYTDQAYKAKYDAWKQDDPAAALADFQQSAKRLSPLVRDSVESELFTAAAPQLAAQINQAGGVGIVGAPKESGNLSVPRGLRNNNPGNIVKGAQRWDGEVPGNDAKFASFATPEDGIRALCKNLLAFQDKHGLNTVDGIVSRWAPATENDTNVYIKTVAKTVKADPDTPLDLKNPQTLEAFCRAIIKHENGKIPYSDDQIAAGIQAALSGGTVAATPEQRATAKVQANTWRDPSIQTGYPVIDGLRPDQRMRVLELAQTQANQASQALRSSLSARERDAKAEYLATGTSKSAPSEAEYLQAYGQLDGLSKFRELQDTARYGQYLQQTKTASNADLMQMVKDAKPEQGEGFADRQRNYEALQRAVDETMKEREKDPIAYALQQNGYGLGTLKTFNDPQAFGQEMARRANAMDDVSRDYGTPPRVMTNEEADAFARHFETVQVQDKERVLYQLISAVGPAGVQSISQQTKDKFNTLSVAAMLATAAPQDPNAGAARLYLRGKEAIEKKLVKLDDAAETGTLAQINKAIDGVYQTPTGQRTAAEAALGIYAGLRADGNGSLDDAVEKATGGIMAYNNQKLAKPYGWSDGQFEDWVKRDGVKQVLGLQDAKLRVNGYEVDRQDLAAKLPGAKLYTVGAGTYAIGAGSDVVRDDQGQPVLLKVLP